MEYTLIVNVNFAVTVPFEGKLLERRVVSDFVQLTIHAPDRAGAMVKGQDLIGRTTFATQVNHHSKEEGVLLKHASYWYEVRRGQRFEKFGFGIIPENKLK